ncbi:hypothetical protein [Calycomorphotria hydatis]|uniref:Uncharacterized protein n=1 Tax=Calycomorphotria hydatis TaxID=2528027 RepID=A0A517TBI6_9PLAN|nr:hypothetical protein [Calycomorphotria hydatis]QDT65738.1 hypothetical protein V22_29980 [Calycomorphotria hydatis]
MADREYNKYQQKVIQRFYDNREQIDHQTLAELVTNLYLSEGKKRAKHWETAKGVMERLKVPKSRIEHVINSDDPTVLAAVVEDLEKGRI